jgi:mono/diheme cytochrome c family protein
VLGRIALALVALVVALGMPACGGDDDEAEGTTEATTDDGAVADGRTVFVDNCGSCHTLSDAGTSGSIGPNLDEVSLSADQVEEQVRNGGGGMPAFEGDLTDEEIQAVSAYVVETGSG